MILEAATPLSFTITPKDAFDLIKIIRNSFDAETSLEEQYKHIRIASRLGFHIEAAEMLSDTMVGR